MKKKIVVSVGLVILLILSTSGCIGAGDEQKNILVYIKTHIVPIRENERIYDVIISETIDDWWVVAIYLFNSQTGNETSFLCKFNQNDNHLYYYDTSLIRWTGE